ncbi:hypothetical protein [uncultured Sunxiuqinia sp.]|uniref:hypothetical protein n=1 Tax=uncultured Sunxiuqinia sp. TaxID=1573825 RepID=UPI002AA78CAA|nr:hypothetical protein [uncultured Sunxiuqinia sp.]
MKKKTTLSFLIVLLLGFSFSFYTKYVRSYIPGIEKTESADNHQVTSKKLTLSQTIAFLEHLEETRTKYLGVAKVNGDENAKAIKKLKTINMLSIAGMILFFFLFIWLMVRLRKSKRTSYAHE